MGKPYVRSIITLANIPYADSVVLYDNFEDLLKWTATGDGADFTVEADNSVAFFSSKSLHLKTRTTGAAANDEVEAERTLPIPSTNFLLISFLFKWKVRLNVSWFKFNFDFEINEETHDIGIRFKPRDNETYYVNSSGSAQQFSAASVLLNEDYWHKLSLKINLQKKEYVQLIVDNIVEDMAGISYDAGTTTAKSKGLFNFQLVAHSTTPPEAWIDDLIILSIDE